MRTDLALDARLGALAGVRVTVSLALAATHLPGNPDVLALLLLHALDVADAGLPQQGPALPDGERLGRRRTSVTGVIVTGSGLHSVLR